MGDISDGIILCSIVNNLDKTAIDWKTVEVPPKNDFAKNGNCGVAIKGAKGMGLKLIGIGGNAIVQKVEKDVMSILWVLMKHKLLSSVKGKSEKVLIQWCNDRVEG